MASEFLSVNPIEQYPLKFQNMQALIDLSNAQLELYKETATIIEKVENSGFFATADEATVKRYESMIGIVAEPGQTLEFRRARLQNRFNLNRKFVMRFYCEKFNELIGVGKWSATLNAKRTLLTIESAATDADWINELNETINLVKPLRLNAVIKPLLQNVLEITADTSSQYMQYSYRVGVSHIGVDTIGRAYSEEIEVGGTIMISSSELNKTTEFIKNQIAAVKINDELIISDFTAKDVSENTLTIEYIVPSDVGTVSNIKLIDTDGDIMAEQNVNVETSDNVLLKHNFVIKEGE